MSNEHIFDIAIEKVVKQKINKVLGQIRDEIEAIAINGQVDEHTAFIRSG